MMREKDEQEERDGEATRRLSDRTTLRVRPRSRIRNTIAEARLPMMRTKATTMTHFMVCGVAVEQWPF